MPTKRTPPFLEQNLSKSFHFNSTFFHLYSPPKSHPNQTSTCLNNFPSSDRFPPTRHGLIWRSSSPSQRWPTCGDKSLLEWGGFSLPKLKKSTKFTKSPTLVFLKIFVFLCKHHDLFKKNKHPQTLAVIVEADKLASMLFVLPLCDGTSLDRNSPDCCFAHQRHQTGQRESHPKEAMEEGLRFSPNDGI